MTQMDKFFRSIRYVRSGSSEGLEPISALNKSLQTWSGIDLATCHMADERSTTVPHTWFMNNCFTAMLPKSWRRWPLGWALKRYFGICHHLKCQGVKDVGKLWFCWSNGFCRKLKLEPCHTWMWVMNDGDSWSSGKLRKRNTSNPKIRSRDF